MKTQLPKPVAARVWIGRMEDLVLDYLYSEQGDGEPLFTEAQLKAAMVAAWNEAIEESVTAMWHSYTEGPEAMEVLMDKLKEQTP